ncbi:Hypothetical protein R9X50_00461900 [Acrodontium crateriforme]|uniref:FHA domain-containing protein n=1 Tax=Acrodontium crateriforme TaxID=150365 RepID=A0AAQ3M4L4_9PEZI|nr:Hypothetical protein R9X50_00461900 [Acrodontium crateriforme]
MTAVAQPVNFQPSTRVGWSSNGNGFSAMNSDEVSRMFASGPRKSVQRQNSASSIASTNSSTSTVSISSAQSNGTTVSAGEAGNWAARKKPTRGLWPPGKAEAATGITTARPQAINSTTSGPTASSAISALHTPMLPSQQAANGNGQANSGPRAQAQPEPPAILHLLPMNGTFERKTITVPYFPDILRIGRQTNQKTIPTPLNGYFDSKVLSRQHAEVWADRQGRVFIRDVKSSNGTFVNGMRLSQENKESEPRELREQDVLELGIDIVSEDQKTVVHHKVAAKVEHAGVYGQGNDSLNFNELDPSAGGLMGAQHQLKRNASQGSINDRMAVGNPALSQQAMNMGAMGKPQHIRNWLNPITTENLVKKLNMEMKMAMQQNQDLVRARQQIEALLGGKVESPVKDSKTGSEKPRSSPMKVKTDFKTHFSEPPAPPPQAPLPEKPDVLRALADPIIQPLLRRNETARPALANDSPTRNDHSSDILRLCEELKLAKGELSNQSARMRTLENELAQERTARESAEERAQRLLERRDSPTTSCPPDSVGDDDNDRTVPATFSPDLQQQLDRLHATMDEMKQQVESYRRRAETAESERDKAQKSLSEMVEEKRKENAHRETPISPSKSPKSLKNSTAILDAKPFEVNGHAILPKSESPTGETLFERAGVENGHPITAEQAKILTEMLSREVLNLHNSGDGDENPIAYYTRPYGSAAAVVLLGFLVMTWVNGWPKVER